MVFAYYKDDSREALLLALQNCNYLITADLDMIIDKMFSDFVDMEPYLSCYPPHCHLKQIMLSFITVKKRS